MRKTQFLILFLLLLSPLFLFAQEAKTNLDAESLIPMYRTWVKMLFVVIVVLSLALLIVGLKFIKLKQETNSSKKK